MRAGVRIAWLAGIFAAALGGCGGGSEEGNPDPFGLHGPIAPSGPLASDTFTEHLLAAICNGTAPCCAQEGLPYNSLGCTMSVSLFFGVAYGLGQAAGTFDLTAAESCIASYSSMLQDCNATAQEGRMAEEACSRVYTGTTPLGGNCSLSAECKPEGEGVLTCGTWESDSLAPSEVRCQMVRAGGKAGDPCVSHAEVYIIYTCDAPDLWCDEYGSFSCKPRVQEGQACTNVNECAAGAWCDGGICSKKRGAGQPCTTSEDACDTALMCGTAGSCAARLQAGEPCSSSEECASESCMSVCQPEGGVASSMTCGSGATP